MPFVLVHHHTALSAFEHSLSCNSRARFLPCKRMMRLAKLGSRAQLIRKLCAARKDSVRRRGGKLSPLVSASRRPYNGYFLFMSFFLHCYRWGRPAGFLFLAFLAAVSA